MKKLLSICAMIFLIVAAIPSEAPAQDSYWDAISLGAQAAWKDSTVYTSPAYRLNFRAASIYLAVNDTTASDTSVVIWQVQQRVHNDTTTANWTTVLEDSLSITGTPRLYKEVVLRDLNVNHIPGVTSKTRIILTFYNRNFVNNDSGLNLGYYNKAIHFRD